MRDGPPPSADGPDRAWLLRPTPYRWCP